VVGRVVRVGSVAIAFSRGGVGCDGVAMSEISVRVLREADWQVYRDIRLAALREAPGAFVATRAQEEALDEQRWRERLSRSRRLVAERNGRPLGVVSVGHTEEPDPDTAELFGLWVEPEARGTGVAWRLVEAGADQALRDGLSHLSYWVGTDNGRAVAFASSFGFRPGANRRPMRVAGEEDGAEEMAMVLPLGVDPGSVPSTRVR
jgi:ribosomal protein S18 acetylase RimI-like enzyme